MLVPNDPYLKMKQRHLDHMWHDTEKRHRQAERVQQYLPRVQWGVVQLLNEVCDVLAVR